jgi:hypothetical protein
MVESLEYLVSGGGRGWFEVLMFGVEGGLSFPYFLEFGQRVDCFLLNEYGVVIL